MRLMKDSGINWIGDIPDTWNISRTKNYFANHKLIVGEKADQFDRLALTLNGVIKRPKDDTIGLQPEAFNGYQVLKENELVFKLIDLENVSTSRVGLSPFTGIVSPAYIILKNTRDVIMKYCEYYYLSIWQREVFNHMGDAGVRSSLNASDLLNIPFLIPPISEQKAISSFLDRQCNIINNIIEQTKISIEDYKNLKRAVVTEAVTRGVRGLRIMKSCEIEWLHEIPTDWEDCRIKNVIFPQEKAVKENDDIITCFRDGEVTLRKKRREEGYTISFTEHGYHGVDVGDLVIHGMDAFAGSIGCSDSRGKISPVVHVCHTIGNNRYFMYYLRAMAYGNILMDLSNGVRIRSSDFRNFAKLGVFRVCVPSLKEQNEIVSYLDNKTAEIDSLIRKKELICAEMESYKRSLVYEYVTGKKEVAS